MSKSKISKSESIPEFEESIKNMSEQDKNRVDSSMDKMEKLQQSAEDTRQEIIDKYEGNGEYPSYYHEHNIHLMMQEYAEQYWNGWVSVERTFTETEISHLQSAVHKITGDGEVMMLFNKLLGIAAGK